MDFFYENWTVDVNWPKKCTIKFTCFYLFKKCQREKQKTEIDCQINKMRVKQDWLANSFAPNTFTNFRIKIDINSKNSKLV